MNRGDPINWEVRCTHEDINMALVLAIALVALRVAESGGELDCRCADGLRIKAGCFRTFILRKRIPANHPLRKIRELVREVLKELNHTFRKLYSHEGRPAISPEQLAGRSDLGPDDLLASK